MFLYNLYNDDIISVYLSHYFGGSEKSRFDVVVVVVDDK